MKLGYCSWLLGGLKLPDTFDFLHGEGCTCVSILQNIMAFDKGEKAEAAAFLKEKGMTLCVHGNVQNNLTPAKDGFDEDFLKALYDEIDWWNEATGGLLYDCCSDSINDRDEEGNRRSQIKLSYELFRRHAAHFAGTGIRYGIENTCGSDDPHDLSFYNCDPRFQEAYDLFGGDRSAGLLLDVGHAYVASLRQDIDFETYLDSIPFEVCELHITDNHGKWDEHLKPGMGTLDFKALRRAMDKRGFDGPVNLEVCKNLSENIYGFDISQPGERDYVRGVIADFRASYMA